jgi:hypothetical protein
MTCEPDIWVKYESSIGKCEEVDGNVDATIIADKFYERFSTLCTATNSLRAVELQNEYAKLGENCRGFSTKYTKILRMTSRSIITGSDEATTPTDHCRKAAGPIRMPFLLWKVFWWWCSVENHPRIAMMALNSLVSDWLQHCNKSTTSRNPTPLMRFPVDLLLGPQKSSTSWHVEMLWICCIGSTARTPLIRFVVDLLYNLSYNKSTTNRTSGVWALGDVIKCL